MHEEIIIWEMADGHVRAEFPHTNTHFRAELDLLAGVAVEAGLTGSSRSVWVFPYGAVRRLVEAVEDFYPHARVIGPCDECFSLGVDVRFRSVEVWRESGVESGWSSVGLVELCDLCARLKRRNTLKLC